MTVSELIAMLQALPDQSTRVMVRGYEAGYNDVGHITTRQVLLDCNSEWYYGRHATSDDWEKSHHPHAEEVAAYIIMPSKSGLT